MNINKVKEELNKRSNLRLKEMTEHLNKKLEIQPKSIHQSIINNFLLKAVAELTAELDINIDLINKPEYVDKFL